MLDHCEDRDALPIGAKLYFNDSHHDGFFTKEGALEMFGNFDIGTHIGATIEIFVRQLLARCPVEITYGRPIHPPMTRASKWSWVRQPPKGTTCFNSGTRDLNEALMGRWSAYHEGDPETETVMVECWADLATIRYAAELRHIETLLAAQEVAAHVRANGNHETTTAPL